MKLIIAEKGALAKAIAEAIPGSGKQENGVITKGEYVITWASGHLLELKRPEDYEEDLLKWKMETLPIYFPNWEVRVKEKNGKSMGPDAEERVKLIGSLLKKADCVIHAGDPDEEGQRLIDELLEWFDYKKPVYRLQTADTTKVALTKALQNMTDNEKHKADGESAYARTVADIMVGINLSRYYTLKNNHLLTIGRVQSPTLGLVVERDKLIENHTKAVYYEINADAGVCNQTIDVKYTPSPKDENLEDGMIIKREYAETKAKEILGKKRFTVTEKEESESPPLPFNLGKLQSYCSSKWGYSLQQTLDITQALRDKYNAISYNRTDVQYLPETCFAEAPKTLQTVVKNINYSPAGLDPTIHSKCFNDKNIEAHFAMIPQNVSLDISKFSEQERNVYLAICKYYLAQFLPNAKKKKKNMTAELSDGGKLTASATEILFPGYRIIFKKDEDFENKEDTPLNLISPGIYEGEVTNARISEKETKPPRRYTQASLNEDMTRISKYVDDAEVKKLLIEKDKDKKGENGSIGTVATRAGIIENLIKRGYLKEEKKGKTASLISTELGRELYRILPDDLKKPNLTAYWWVVQEDIRKGKATHADLEMNVLDMIKKIISSKSSVVEEIHLTEVEGSLGKCPWCGCAVVENEKAYGCSNWKNGCTFAIWKQNKAKLFSKVKYTKTDVSNLLAGKTTGLKKLVKNDDTEFEAYLKLKPEKNENGLLSMEFVFPNSPDAPKKSTSEKKSEKSSAKSGDIGNCPWCGSPLIETDRAFGCSGWKSGCKFVIWKTSKLKSLSKVKFTNSDIKKLVGGKETSAKTIIKKDGSETKGTLKLKPKNGDNVDFEIVFKSTGKENKR